MKDFIQFLWKYRKPLLKINITVAIASVIISLLLPKWYRSSLTFMIEEGDQSSLLSSLVGTIPLPFAQGLTSPADRYIAILKSRRVLDAVIDRFDLKEVYNSRYMEDAYKSLMNNSAFIDNEDGTVTIECLYKEDPVIAAEMANFFFVKAESVSVALSQERARKFREYMELALEDAYRDLAAAEDSLNAFQNMQDVVDIEEQLKALIEQIAVLEVKKMSLEIERDYLESIHTEGHPEVQSLEKNIEIISDKIRSLKTSSDYSNIPLEQVPDLGMMYLRLYRSIEIKQKVIEFLVPQVEQARIEEQKTSSNLVVLDWAVPFERKAKPKRAYVCIGITLLGFIFSSGYYWARERYGISRQTIREFLEEPQNQ